MNDAGHHESDLSPPSSLDGFIFSTLSKMFQVISKVYDVPNFLLILVRILEMPEF